MNSALFTKSVLSQQAGEVVPGKGILSSTESGIEKVYQYIYWNVFGIPSRPFADSVFNRFPANCGVRKGQFAEMFHFK